MFVFDSILVDVLAEFDARKWERAIREAGGSVARAAAKCGVEGLPGNARALIGRSAEEARRAGGKTAKR